MFCNFGPSWYFSTASLSISVGSSCPLRPRTFSSVSLMGRSGVIISCWNLSSQWYTRLAGARRRALDHFTVEKPKFWILLFWFRWQIPISLTSRSSCSRRSRSPTGIRSGRRSRWWGSGRRRRWRRAQASQMCQWSGTRITIKAVRTMKANRANCWGRTRDQYYKTILAIIEQP